MLLLLSHAVVSGECLDVAPETCSPCVQSLVTSSAAFDAWQERSSNGRGVAPCDFDCSEQCVFGPTLEVLIHAAAGSEAGKRDRALALIKQLRPYRGWCGDSTVLDTIAASYSDMPEAAQNEVLVLLDSFQPTGRGRAGLQEKCVAALGRLIPKTQGQLGVALAATLVRLSVWEEPKPQPNWFTAEVQGHYFDTMYPLPDAVSGYLSEPYQRGLRNLSRTRLRKLRNAVLARRGRQFKDPKLQAFFSAQSWYRPHPNYSDSKLTAADRHNLKVIRQEETRR